METRKEIKFLIWTVVIFLTAFFLPVNSDTLMTAIHSTLDLANGTPVSISFSAFSRHFSSPV